MGRSGYSEDWCYENPGELNLYRGNVDRAIAGKRGQRLLRDLIAALDELPKKELIDGELEIVDGQLAGSVCALGAVGRRRGIDMTDLDPYDAQAVAEAFDIAEPLAREIVDINDDVIFDFRQPEVERQKRWRYVRTWAQLRLREEE